MGFFFGGKMIYQSVDSTQKIGVGSSFDLTKKATLDLDINYRSSFWGSLQGLWIHVSSATSSPTKITFRICSDTLGDKMLVTDTEGDLFFGITSATTGSVVYKIDIPLLLSTETVYLMAKTDTGTVNIDEVVLSWQQEEQ